MRIARLRHALLLAAGVLVGTGLTVFAAEDPSPSEAQRVPPAVEVIAEGDRAEEVPAAPGTEAPTEDVAAPTAAPTTEPSPADDASAEPTAEPDDGALAARLEEVVGGFPLSRVRVGIAVVDDRGTVHHRRNVGHAALPASTQKLVVAASALATLGPEHRFSTRVGTAGRVDGGGVLQGDLLLVGGGDPTLVTPEFATRIMPERPSTPLDDLAAQLEDAGVTRITGDVIGDPSYLPDDPLPTGWPERYLTTLDGSRSSGLTVDAGRRLRSRGGQLLGESAEDPALEAARHLHLLLERRGVRMDGKARVRRDTAPTVLLGEVRSPPLQDILRYMVQTSDNHLAEGIHRAVGAAAGDGTYAGAARAAVEALDPLELDWSAAVVADGSGLSRDNRLTPRLLASLDAAMHRSTAAEAWDDLMAVTGESGTLRRRLRGTIAEGRVRGKTGFLGDVRAFAGSAVGPGGRRLHVAVLGNDLDGAEHQLVRDLTDAVLLALVEHLFGCVHLPVETPEPEPPADAEPDGTPPPAVAELACAGT